MTRASAAVSTRIIDAVAEHRDCSSLELPPLYNAIDPDALKTVLSTMSDGEVRFHYAGVTVVIDSDRAIRTTGSSHTIPEYMSEGA